MATIREEIKAMKASLVETIKAMGIKKENPKALDLKTNDGKMIVVETEADTPAVGDKCTMDGNPVPDGEYTLEDGTKITVAAGAITAVTAPAEDKTKAQLTEDVKKLTEQNKALTDQNKALTDELTAAKADVQEVLALAKEMKSKKVIAPRSQTFTRFEENSGEVTKEEMKERREKYKSRKTVFDTVKG